MQILVKSGCYHKDSRLRLDLEALKIAKQNSIIAKVRMEAKRNKRKYGLPFYADLEDFPLLLQHPSSLSQTDKVCLWTSIREQECLQLSFGQIYAIGRAGFNNVGGMAIGGLFVISGTRSTTARTVLLFIDQGIMGYSFGLLVGT